MEHRNLKESRLNNWVSFALRLGVAVSLALIVIGFIILLITSDANDIHPLASLDQIPAAIVISVGILILLLTPIIQVIAATVFFLIVRDRLFICISVAVFCFAAISLVLALI
ncbi:MAG: DUF1634 domain-containing protein [Chloroflexota bacterium]|nr:MAG: DUF1634 domain-containing protein [Chloroflexota bacterium]